MTPPLASGHGMGEEPSRDSKPPGGRPGRGTCGRDERLAAFGQRDSGDRLPPSGWLGMVLDDLSGQDRRCPGASDDELAGLLRRWAAMKSWATAGKLGVLAELVRRRARPGHENRRPGGLPGAFEEGAGHEAAAALTLSVPAADNLIDLAVTLQARLPGIYAKLADGTIDYLRAKIIADETGVLDDALVAAAEALILAGLAGKTPSQVGKLAASAVAAVDPKGAQRRREQAEREQARVCFWRERAGTSALAAYGLPTDAALAANATIAARARQYKEAKLDGTMDQLRVLGYLDILNGIPAHERIAAARAEAQAHTRSDPGPDTTDPAAPAHDPSTGPDSGTDRTPDAEVAGASSDVDGSVGDDWSADDDDSGHRADGPADDGPAGQPGGTGPALTAAANLTIPLAGLLGLTDRPGEAHGLGPLDPALCRDLAAAAARSPHSTWCITITSPQGYAIGHGCARPARRSRGKSPPPGTREWTFTKRHDHPGPPGGWGAWTLTLPGGRQFDVQLGPIPVTDCDHRYESRGYQPGDLLRHLVQIRDGECTFPCCSRHARESDFEHALPYDQGGKTCACNAGARSRRCHRVKQSKGWKVTQPRPGWHQWTAPSGRTYTQGPRSYPA